MFTKIAKSKPNGQVVGMGVSTPILMQLVMRPEKMAFNIDDFDYIATVARGELAVVARSDAPFNDLESMVKYAKANGPIKMALNAKPAKFVLGAVSKATGAKFQYVTTKGGAETMKLLMGKQVMAGTAGGGATTAGTPGGEDAGRGASPADAAASAERLAAAAEAEATELEALAAKAVETAAAALGALVAE